MEKRKMKEIDELGRSDRGAYILEFRIDDAISINVGRLGRIRLEAGWHYYVGSAMGGLRGRILRHVVGGGKRHWHVDYLREKTKPLRVWWVVTRRRVEGEVAGIVRRKCKPSVKGFGCSDRRESGTHLFYSRRRRIFAEETRELGRVGKWNGR